MSFSDIYDLTGGFVMDAKANLDMDHIDLPFAASETTPCVVSVIPTPYYPSDVDSGFAPLETIPEGEPLTTFAVESRPDHTDAGVANPVNYDNTTTLLGTDVDTAWHDGTDESRAHLGESHNETSGHANHGKHHPDLTFTSLNRIMIDNLDLEIEEIVPSFDDFVATPLRIIGSGWEFGSICSIPLQSIDGVSLNGNGMRSRSNTMERKTFIGSQASIFTDNRILSRVIARSFAGSKMSIGSKFSRNFEKDVYTSLTDVGEFPPTTEIKDVIVPKSTRNLKNLLVISIVFMCLHIAIYGLRNLQSSLNSEGGLGVISLALSYALFMFGSLISQFIVLRFSPKRCMVAACTGNILYVLANIYPSYLTIVPASAIQGIANAAMWTSICTYITEIGINEARHKMKKSDSIQSKFFGVFFVAIQLAMVLGNLFSSIILIKSNNTGPIVIENNMNNDTSMYTAPSSGILSSNMSYISMDNATMLSAPMPGCGSEFMPGQPSARSAGPVDNKTKMLLLSTYTAFACVATLTCQLFLDPLPGAIKVSASIGDVTRQAGRILKMVVDPQFIFCVVLCIYTSSGNGFVIADILQAYVTCPLGIYMVGFSMICFGICGSVSSFLFGKITPLIGRTATFIIV